MADVSSSKQVEEGGSNNIWRHWRYCVALLVLVVVFGLLAIPTAIILLVYLILRITELVFPFNSNRRLIVFLFSLFLLAVSLWGISSSMIVWMIVYKSHKLKHRVILGAELIKLASSFLIFMVFCALLTLSRVFFGVVDDSIWTEAEENNINVKERKLRSSLYNGFTCIYECGIILLAELATMKLYPNWKRGEALGLMATWKLIQKIIIIVLGVTVIKVTTRSLVLILQVAYANRKHVVYYAKRMRESINLVYFSTLWIILWLSNFRPHFKNMAVLHDKTLDFLDWGFFCLAIGAVFWLLKRFIVLKWEAHAVYDRFQKKILQAGLQFYLFLLLVGVDPSDATGKFSFVGNFKGNEEDDDDKSKLSEKHENNNNDGAKNNNSDNYENRDQATKNVVRLKQKGRDIFARLEHVQIPVYQLHRIVKCFSHIDFYRSSLKNLTQKIKSSSFGTSPVSDPVKLREVVKNVCNIKLDSFDATTLYEQIRSIHSNHEVVDEKDLGKWAEIAFKNCLELNNTVQGAKEVAKYLNKLLGGFLLLLVIMIWLLATKIAKTELIVLISSPILAATFIFGETCKNIFQGVIFAFVIHLFDVGDVCVIEGIQMEVIRIGIWKTTFQKVETKEQTIYQNSNLLEMTIVKRKGDLKSINDYVEYCIGISEWSSSKYISFLTHINTCLVKLKCEYHPLGVLVKEVGDKVKIVIHFKHDQPGHLDLIHHECYKQQSITRAELLLEVKDYFDKANEGCVECLIDNTHEWDSFKMATFTTYTDQCLGELKCGKHPQGITVDNGEDRIEENRSCHPF